MERSNFDELLQRYLTGRVSEQEKAKIEAWLDVMKTQDTGELELSKEDEDRLFRKITSTTATVTEVMSIVPDRRRKRFGEWLKIAAALLLIALASYTVFSVVGREETFLAASNGDVDKVILNDGTLVWLRGNSQLQYYHKKQNSGDIRFAELQGEALFEVAKDARRPFVIQCGRVRITVIGTSFNLKSAGDTVELSVLTGKVNMSTDVNGRSIDVEPNEKLIYKGDGNFEKMALTPTEGKVITRQTEYGMAFSNASMSELIEALERKFDVEIEVHDKAINNCQLTIDLTDRSLDESLMLMAEVLHISHSINDKVVSIRGTGCN